MRGGPELSEALAAIIARVRGGNDHVLRVSRYDGAERVHSPALPFLYQRPVGARQQPISGMVITQLLDRVVTLDPIPGADGSPLRFTPHDFRRIFATDAAAAGFAGAPPAKILGHESTATTWASYDEEVIEHHSGFFGRRRSLRPSAETANPPTPTGS